MEEAEGNELVAAVAGGDGATARRLLETLSAQTDEHTDAALNGVARLAAGGSELAVVVLVEMVDELGIARRAVGRYLVDESAVEDVTQDTLITTLNAIETFRGDSKFRTWLYRLARNRAVDYIRRQRATAPLDEGDPRQDAAVRMSSLIASREAVREMLAKLPPAYREAVTLRDVEQLPYADIAARLNRPVNTVKSHVARGRAMVASMVRGELGE